jgi:hypothetical protein
MSKIASGKTHHHRITFFTAEATMVEKEEEYNVEGSFG